MSYFVDYWQTFAVAFLCCVSSCALGMTEILHSPDCPNYRYYPLWVRLIMMGWSTALAYRAFDLFAGLAQEQPQMIGGSAVVAGIWQTATVVALLIEALRGRLTVKGQAKIALIYLKARCFKPRGNAA